MRESQVSAEAELRDFIDSAGPGLQRFAWALTRDWAAAEDLLQVALVKLWLRWESIASASRTAYARKVILSSFLSRLRLRSSSEIPMSADHELDRAVGDESRSIDERVSMMNEMRLLTRRQHAAIVLRYFEDLSESETASLMNCSVGTVKRHTSRAIAKLRQSLILTEEFMSNGE